MAQFNKTLTVNHMTIDSSSSATKDGQLVIRCEDGGTLKVKTIVSDDILNEAGGDLSTDLFGTITNEQGKKVLTDEDEVFITGKAFENYVQYLIANNRKF